MLDLRGRGNATLLAPFRDLHPQFVSSTPSPSPRSALPDTPSPLFVRESERPQNRFRTFETSISLSVNEQRLNGTHVEPVTIATLPSNSGTSFAGSNFMPVDAGVRMIDALCDQPRRRPERLKSTVKSVPKGGVFSHAGGSCEKCSTMATGGNTSYTQYRTCHIVVSTQETTKRARCYACVW